ncbi:MAG TPA: hypothetical protein VJZ75_08395 [Candidatus Bathyarchaeia archaeon]|nr:hypothetical protein [Candidatus Bathyarchaeia archaeon]
MERMEVMSYVGIVTSGRYELDFLLESLKRQTISFHGPVVVQWNPSDDSVRNTITEMGGAWIGEYGNSIGFARSVLDTSIRLLAIRELAAKYDDNLLRRGVTICENALKSGSPELAVLKLKHSGVLQRVKKRGVKIATISIDDDVIAGNRLVETFSEALSYSDVNAVCAKTLQIGDHPYNPLFGGEIGNEKWEKGNAQFTSKNSSVNSLIDHLGRHLYQILDRIKYPRHYDWNAIAKQTSVNKSKIKSKARSIGVFDLLSSALKDKEEIRCRELTMLGNGHKLHGLPVVDCCCNTWGHSLCEASQWMLNIGWGYEDSAFGYQNKPVFLKDLIAIHIPSQNRRDMSDIKDQFMLNELIFLWYYVDSTTFRKVLATAIVDILRYGRQLITGNFGRPLVYSELDGLKRYRSFISERRYAGFVDCSDLQIQ